MALPSLIPHAFLVDTGVVPARVLVLHAKSLGLGWRPAGGHRRLRPLLVWGSVTVFGAWRQANCQTEPNHNKANVDGTGVYTSTCSTI